MNPRSIDEINRRRDIQVGVFVGCVLTALAVATVWAVLKRVVVLEESKRSDRAMNAAHAARVWMEGGVK